MMEGSNSVESVCQSTRLAWGIADIAAVTGLSVPYLRLEIKRKKLHAKHFGRRVLILHDDLLAYLKREVDESNGKSAEEAA